MKIFPNTDPLKLFTVIQINQPSIWKDNRMISVETFQFKTNNELMDWLRNLYNIKLLRVIYLYELTDIRIRASFYYK